jgi:hypothetical protein
MRDRRPRLNKKLNSKDRNATVRIKIALPRTCICRPSKSWSTCNWREARGQPYLKRVQLAYVSEEYQEKGECELRKFVL